jgi:hypothetical protein
MRRRKGVAWLIAPLWPIAAFVSACNPSGSGSSPALDGSPTGSDASGTDGGSGLDAAGPSPDGAIPVVDGGAEGGVTTHSQCTKPTTGWWGVGPGFQAEASYAHLFLISEGSDGWVADLGRLTDSLGAKINIPIITAAGGTVYGLGAQGIYTIDPVSLTATLFADWNSFTNAPQGVPSPDAFAATASGNFVAVQGTSVYCIAPPSQVELVGYLPGGVDSPPFGLSGSCTVTSTGGGYDFTAVADHGGSGCSFFTASGTLDTVSGMITHTQSSTFVGGFYSQCGPGSAGLVGAGTIAQGAQGLILGTGSVPVPYESLHMCFSEDAPNALNGVVPHFACIAGN